MPRASSARCSRRCPSRSSPVRAAADRAGPPPGVPSRRPLRGSDPVTLDGPPPPPGDSAPPPPQAEPLTPIVLPAGAPTRSPVLLIVVGVAAFVGLVVNSVGLAGFPSNAPIEAFYALG